MATINSHYFRVCTGGARRLGMDVTPLLAAAGLDSSQLADPLWRGSVAAMAQLVRLIWTTLGDEFMGCTATRVKPGTFALMGELAVHQESVYKAIAKGADFYNTIQNEISTDVRREAGEVIIDIRFAHPEKDPDHYFVEFWMIIWHRLACWLAGETISLHRASFSYSRPDAYFEEFKYLFPCPHRFNQTSCQLRLDLQQMLAPVRRTPEEMDAMLKEAPLELMTIPASDHSLARGVRLLLAHRDSLQLSLEEVAEHMQLSVETLRRQLRREGTSLSRIVQNLQRDRAIRRLLESNRTVEEIAGELGYAEARSFTRAFRKWTGCSPSEYRRRFGRD